LLLFTTFGFTFVWLNVFLLYYSSFSGSVAITRVLLVCSVPFVEYAQCRVLVCVCRGILSCPIANIVYVKTQECIMAYRQLTFCYSACVLILQPWPELIMIISLAVHY